MLFQKLFVALSKDDILTAARVVALGAEVSAHTNPDGKTLLHGAAEEGRVLILEFLIINGADFTARDDDGRWPLHLAAQSGHLECAKLLLARQGENAAHDVRAIGFRSGVLLGGLTKSAGGLWRHVATGPREGRRVRGHSGHHAPSAYEHLLSARYPSPAQEGTANG